MEPPILEDISDATPIQSDNESEDEDIDELAFNELMKSKIKLIIF